MKIVVLGGAGAMGQAIVRDLIESEPVKQVVIADFNEQKAAELKSQLGSGKLQTAFADIRETATIVAGLDGATAVINSTPYYFNLNVMEAALEANCHYLDLGGLFHVTQEQLKLDQRFKQKGLLAVLGMGAAPGMTNVMAASAAADLDLVKAVDIYIGCVDFTKVAHPFYPPYALDTILDEYTKQPMVYQAGKFHAAAPMSGEMTVDFPEPVGRVKAIYTLHSEVATLPLTYRDKGIENVTFRLGLPLEFHERLKFLVDLGLGSTETLELPEGPAVPRKVLSKLIDRFPSATDEPDDCEVVRVDVTGTRADRNMLVRLETTVFPHPQWRLSCGALDTGIPPSIVAQMIGLDHIRQTGVLAPEVCVPPESFFAELAKRSIIMRKITEEVLCSAKEESPPAVASASKSTRS